MHIYLAGSCAKLDQEIEILDTHQYRLFSFYDMCKKVEYLFSDIPAIYFLDSGAFSAWTHKESIELSTYIDFIHQYKDKISIYANLDVIGDVKNTWRNQKRMEKKGLNPLPVFHVEDPIDYLYKCIDEYEYFCIGGMVKGYSTFERTQFLDRCFNIIESRHTSKFPKIHGFGMTSLDLMLRYPWYSVDSTTWLLTAAMGVILIPRNVGNTFVYDDAPWKIAVSTKSMDVKKAGQHLDNISPLFKKFILQYIEQSKYPLGISEFRNVSNNYVLNSNEQWVNELKNEVDIIKKDGLINHFHFRKLFNTTYFHNLQEHFSFKKCDKLYSTNIRLF